MRECKIIVSGLILLRSDLSMAGHLVLDIVSDVRPGPCLGLNSVNLSNLA